MNIVKVVSIGVTKLFGLFDHDLRLKTDAHITIIHGSNGLGKTTLLGMINSLLKLKFSEIAQIRFQRFTVVFDDGSMMQVINESESDNTKKLNIKYTSRYGESENYIPIVTIDEERMNFPLAMIEDAVPGLDQIGRRLWRYLPSGETLALEEVVTRFSEYLPDGILGYEELPPWLATMKDNIPVQFIQTQRLFTNRTVDVRRRFNGRIMENSVSIYAQELAEAIESRLTEYGNLSQSLDRTFPARLVRFRGDQLSIEELLTKLDELERKRAKLISLGLLDNNAEPDLKVGNDEIDERTKSVLSIYVQDMEDKLHVFDGLAARVYLLKTIVQNKFKFKHLVINKDKGMSFVTSAGESLQPTSLSSGEQHQIVLLYELLFKINKDSLILIDEPELSLHIGWQVQFLKDLQRITKIVPFDVLIATHSPQIINDRWDLTVDLEDDNIDEPHTDSDVDYESEWWEE